MRVSAWFRLVSEHGFRIHPFRWPLAFGVTVVSFINTILGTIQSLMYGARIKSTEIEQPPVFIIGHWRSGTTHLHELMVRDAGFGYPTTYECFAPHHFLLTRKPMILFGGWLLPRKRPMDNMAAAWDRPQEDEFALCSMGTPTPYRRMAFPKDEPCHQEFLDMSGVSESDLKSWQADLRQFVRLLTFDKKRRIILKSPPHTGRIKAIADVFPGAKFIHIARDPHSVFPSTQRLWRSLDEAQGMQIPKHEDLDEFVHSSMERMYRAFFQQRGEIPASDIIDVTYEDLVANPIEQLERIYRELDLGDFEKQRAHFEDYLGSQRDYKTNRHDLPPEAAAEVDRRWGFFMDEYGYAKASERKASEDDGSD